MIPFNRILKESENLTVEDYNLSSNAEENNIPWFEDGKARYDMRGRSIQAEKIWIDLFSGNLEIRTSDNKKIYLTRSGRKEFFTGIMGAFFGGEVRASTNVFKKNWKLANELLKTVDTLGELISKSRYLNMEPNIKRDKKPDVDHYETFLVPITINGKERKMKIKVELKKMISKEGKKLLKRNYYYHYLQESKITYVPKISNFQFLE